MVIIVQVLEIIESFICRPLPQLLIGYRLGLSGFRCCSFNLILLFISNCPRYLGLDKLVIICFSKIKSESEDLILDFICSEAGIKHRANCTGSDIRILREDTLQIFALGVVAKRNELGPVHRLTELNSVDVSALFFVFTFLLGVCLAGLNRRVIYS